MQLTGEPKGNHKQVESLSRASHDLNETAQKILDAAKTIVERDGYSSLTLRAINREAGVANMGAAGYYFGSKAKVAEAIICQAISDFACVAFPAVPADASLEQRIEALHDSLRDYGNHNSSFLFFEIFPHALRDEVLRAYLAKEYLAYFRGVFDYLFPADITNEAARQRLDYLAQDVAAFQDGMLLQALILGEHYDIRLAHERLGHYVLAAARDVIMPLSIEG